MTMMNEIQSVAKVKGASMKIAELIVQKPLVVIPKNGKIASEETTTEGDEGNLVMTDLKFHYPSKEDVPVLKGVTINVGKN